jgi:hypothetical protein
MQRRPLGVVGIALTAVLGPACMSTSHPLDQDGTVTISSDVTGPLFSPPQSTITVRQRYSADITLIMTEGGQPADRAFVEVTVNPDGLLTLFPADGDDSCATVDGIFRCTSTHEGLANFRIEADGAPSSAGVTRPSQQGPQVADVTINWSGSGKASLPVTVLPPGLPSDVHSLTLSVGGAGGAQHLGPTYHALKCLTALMSPLAGGNVWPPNPRALPVVVQSEVPPDDPTVVTNAPVMLQSMSPEAAFSATQDCSNRSQDMTLTLDDAGQATAWACFSDLGGSLEGMNAHQIALSVASGEAQVGTTGTVSIAVDPEPLALSVIALDSLLPTPAMYPMPTPLFQLAAYDILGQPATMDVQISLTGTSVSLLGQATYTVGGAMPSVVDVTATTAGTIQAHVWAPLAPSIMCPSSTVTVSN